MPQCMSVHHMHRSALGILRRVPYVPLIQVRGSCESPDVGAGNKTRSSTKVASALINEFISPMPEKYLVSQQSQEITCPLQPYLYAV